MDDDQIPADHVRATQVGYAVALRLLREDEHTYEDGEELIDQMGELAGSHKRALGLFLTSLGVAMRRIDGGDRFLEMMISMSAKQAEATERDSTDQD